MPVIHVDDFDKESYFFRFRLYLLIVAIVFGLLVFRLADLQLVEGQRYEKMSRAQKLREIALPAVRGDIVDRNGRQLAVTREAFRLVLYAHPSLKEISDLTGTIAELLGISKEEVEKRMPKRITATPFQPLPILENLSREDVAAIEENLAGVGGLEVELVYTRVYPQGRTASQLLGYLGEVTGKDLDPQSNPDYKPGDIVGRMGIEEALEDALRGRSGKQQVVVDSTGKRNFAFEKELNLPPPQLPETGDTVELTIDLDLQHAAEEALGNNVGAVVVMDVNTGEILAMASTPGFDPNHLISPLNMEEWELLSNDPKRPFMNRAVQGEYPPGSIYKIVVAAAGLSENVVRPEEVIRCDGVVEMGANKDRYHCWLTTGHGFVDVYRALAESCDVYFYRLGERLGIERIRDYSFKFGLGSTPVLHLPSVKSGLMPDPLWKQRVIGKPWYLGDTVITAIGQGYTLMTPLQAARMTAVVANGGKLIKPQLVRRILKRDGTVVREFVPQVEIPNVVSPEICRIIMRGLYQVVNNPKGTGFGYLGYSPSEVAGKTGTAQVVSKKVKAKFIEEQGEVPWEFRDHAWFVAVAPVSNPQIAVSVVVEHGGGGSTSAEPVCGKVIKFYMENRYKQARY